MFTKVAVNSELKMDFFDNIPEKIREKLRKANLASPQEVLSTPDSVFRKHGCTSNDIQFLRVVSSKFICPRFKTVHDVIKTQASKWDRILFGCGPIDACTGGIPTRGITEIYGASGSGKTQLLLQLSLMVQLPPHHGGLGRGAVFINTEDTFPLKRLRQLVQHLNKTFPETKFLENIFIERISDAEALMSCITFRLAQLVKRNNIGLILIDSVAAIYRLEDNIITRADHMRKLADNLLHLIDQHNCAVICVNQVTADLENDGIDVPCLGLAWSNLVRTRLHICKSGRHSLCKRTGENVPVRKLEVIYSYRVSCKACEFLITSEGPVSL